MRQSKDWAGLEPSATAGGLALVLERRVICAAWERLGVACGKTAGLAFEPAGRDLASQPTAPSKPRLRMREKATNGFTFMTLPECDRIVQNGITKSQANW